MKFALNILTLLLICNLIFSCSDKKQNEDNKVTSANQSCIKNIIAIDDSIGKVRNHNCEKISLSETITLYTNEIENLNFKNCPSNFTNAFKNHMKAWKEIRIVTDKYPKLRGEMHDLFKVLEVGKDKETFNRLLDSIWSTWAEVEKSMTPLK